MAGCLTAKYTRHFMSSCVRAVHFFGNFHEVHNYIFHNCIQLWHYPQYLQLETLGVTRAWPKEHHASNIWLDVHVEQCEGRCSLTRGHQEMHNTQMTAMVLHGPGCGHCIIMKQDCISCPNEACVVCKQRCSHADSELKVAADIIPNHFQPVMVHKSSDSHIVLEHTKCMTQSATSNQNSQVIVTQHQLQGSRDIQIHVEVDTTSLESETRQPHMIGCTLGAKLHNPSQSHCNACAAKDMQAASMEQ
ncbi:hypothetical protein C8R48DRAFT_672611 [Suillus tomentosus]|nr:hypothetical protein C8R48DRAFT_672611 [Suillus tomentosus]